jgi:hypothetical protein
MDHDLPTSGRFSWLAFALAAAGCANGGSAGYALPAADAGVDVTGGPSVRRAVTMSGM